MEITEIKVFPVQEEKLKAFVSVVFDRCFMVNDIKIIQGRQGLFISMPSRKKKNGEFKDVAHPLNNDTRQMIEGQVLTEYDRVLEERAAGETSQPRRAPKRRTAPRRSKQTDAPTSDAQSTDDTGGGELGEAKETATETRRRRRSARKRAEPVAAKETTTETSEGEAQRDEAKKTEASSGTEAKDTTGQAEEEETAEKTLEEIEEMHLRDSFWSVP